jgi:hypothetical protein
MFVNNNVPPPPAHIVKGKEENSNTLIYTNVALEKKPTRGEKKGLST